MKRTELTTEEFNAMNAAVVICDNTAMAIGKSIVAKINHRSNSNADMRKNDFIDEINALQDKMDFYHRLADDLHYVLMGATRPYHTISLMPEATPSNDFVEEVVEEVKPEMPKTVKAAKSHGTTKVNS